MTGKAASSFPAATCSPAGALVVGFSSRSRVAAQQQDAPSVEQKPNPPPPLPGSLKGSPFLDSWIKVDADGKITVLTGKVELGQGIKTALLQIAAEELDVPLASLTLVTADTGRTANEATPPEANPCRRRHCHPARRRSARAPRGTSRAAARPAERCGPGRRRPRQ